MFRKSKCLACHAVDQKRLGPLLKEVAAKYQGDSSAADKLARKIREGGVGVWGQLPMPPQPQVSEADAKNLAAYILSL
ncbi:c-type cytochrome [Ramlibacter rhizophilus]|uniref:C-type cytochrome n=1 Tax=Ramlibacter rhizophilus TaxID=1781167 RepID=A0A4Z0BHN5_9BURK|nr:c-type cytochrome [Ramlibacter rhizophilus]